MTTSRLKTNLISLFLLTLAVGLVVYFIGSLNLKWATTQTLTGVEEALAQIEFAISILVAVSSLSFAYFIFKRQTFTWATFFVILLLLTTGLPLTPQYAQTFLSEGVARAFPLYLIVIREAILLGALVLFPDGRVEPKWLRWLIMALFAILIIPIVLPVAPSLNQLIYDPTRYALYLTIVISQIYHYRHLANSQQRQQLKWILLAIAVNLVGRIPTPLLELVTKVANPLTQLVWLRLLISTLPDAFLIIAFGIAALRYRLWDINFFINRALVYSTLTAILGILVTILITLTNNYLKQIFGSQPTLAVILSALPIAASFNPLRTRLQAFVDRYFKPEQVDFSKTFLEFKSDVRTLFAPTELMDILTRRVTAQLNISHSAVFAARADSFVQVMPPRPSETAPVLPLSVERQKQIEKGKIVIPEEDELPFSMLVPLTSPHHNQPRLIGIMALGARSNEQGYPTQVQEALQKLGEEAGTAIYVAQLHQQRANGPR